MSKKLSLLFVFAICTLSVFAQKKDDILGKWLNPSGEGQVEIYKKADKYSGKLVWIKDPNDDKGKPKMDIKNPNANLRSRPVMGLEILKNFAFEDGKWTDGTIYDPKTGKTYSCNLSIKENGELNIRGYIGISLIGRSESWKRVK
ncbi:DUF2147 domain-containing protein [Pedobacter sp. LMG 31464]|uniref:DUF2147 domain-containing protein n=1 Tax=Pedobacter planticolens TaxID=2679964 RepID=A0A923IU48_9SPHI|nr:DUF2147 domain-containing protein [Pedobacter planticolens]MBB2144388.1 DUF2147 domain-containing protein [Pedobacter planticolens]